jgi:hypothetical protein
VAGGVLWAILFLPLLGCGPGRGVASEVVENYVFAVQEEDFERMFCLSAGAAGSPDLGTDPGSRRRAFNAWARGELDAYRDGRWSGKVDLSTSPIPLVKALALGKGTFFRIESVHPAGSGGAIVRMRVRLAYDNVDLSGLSPGTGFFVCGTPIGRIEHIRIPRFSGEVTADVLDEVPIEWTLVREQAASGCEAGWKINDATVEEDGVTTQTVTWVF